MNAHSVVEDWETDPFDGGFDGLARLASRGFDGAVEAAGTWLFFRSGDPIAAVSDLQATPQPASIDSFEGASGREYEAPNPAAATLAAMLALDGEIRGQYFTDDTPLSAVDETLSDGGFTGYVELSENVLSGDYYYVYVDGEVEHVGFVGSDQRLFDEEALSKAENEIGIYDVVAVTLPELELPESESESEMSTDGSPESGAGASPDVPESPAVDDDSDRSVDDETTSEAPSRTSEPDTDAEDDAEPTAETNVGADPDVESAEDRPGDGDPDDSESATDDAPATDPAPYPSADSDAGSSEEPADPAGLSDQNPTESRVDSTGIDSLTTRQVPSLDPKRSDHEEPGKSGTEGDRSGRTRTIQQSSSRPDDRSSNVDADANETADRSREPYEEKIEEYESRIEELEAERSDDEAKIESLEAELDAMQTERDELEAQLEAIETEDDPASDGATSLTAEDAISGTSLFVRERTRGAATLQDAHDGVEDREAVDENLRIEYHTTFDATGATVDGEPFETWLRSSPSYEFAEWLVTELLFEIRSTHTREGLEPLYDALPAVDRIGFDETVSIDSASGDDNGEGSDPETVHFDIIAKDKKGNLLVGARFDQHREPTRADTIGSFITGCSHVCEANESFAAGVVVTSSYFESDAMDAAEEATSSSLLSRSRHRGYVKLSRSNGYHLCLVEARDETFNLTEPEL